MENIHQFDPRSGYVALPSALLDLDLAPGPFRLLTELCRMANKAGECWPSFGQLSARIGRSKAAISGYLEALREASLVETQKQKMANGYNYRLKFRVVFWPQWRKELSPSSPEGDQTKKTERTVQPSERRVNSKNQIQENQTPSPKKPPEKNALLESVFSIWSDLAKGAPFPDFNGPIPRDLIPKTSNLVKTCNPVEAEPTSIQSALSRTWASFGVPISPNQLSRQTETIASLEFSEAELGQVQTEIGMVWKPHWKKAPTDQQFRDIVGRVAARNRNLQKLRALKQFLRRATFAEMQLQRRETSQSLYQCKAA